MNLNLSGKQALVCGSSEGIGKATAEELARMGASITLIARRSEKLAKLCKELNTSAGQKHQYLTADFDDTIALEGVMREHLAAGNQYQILINNTGGPPGGPAHEAGMDEYLLAFRRHLIANQLLVRQLLPGMKEAQWGRIINVISTSVKAPLPNLGVSNTVRGAVANWAKTLATELGPFNITVNNVLPGATKTQRLDSIIAKKAEKSGSTEKETAEKMTAQVPLRRFAEASEVADGIAFLASPAGGYINGINLPVDGGRLPTL